MAFMLAIVRAPGKRRKMTQDVILAETHSRITGKQQLVVPPDRLLADMGECHEPIGAIVGSATRTA